MVEEAKMEHLSNQMFKTVRLNPAISVCERSEIYAFGDFQQFISCFIFLNQIDDHQKHLRNKAKQLIEDARRGHARLEREANELGNHDTIDCFDSQANSIDSMSIDNNCDEEHQSKKLTINT